MKPLATWWTQLTEGVNYYRARMPAKHLPGRCTTLIETVTRKKIIRTQRPGEEPSFRFANQKGNCAIWMFSGNNGTAISMREQQNNGLRVLMEVDDNYLHPPPNPDVAKWTEEAPSDSDGYSYQTHGRIVPWVDGMIVATPKLADVYKDLNPNIYVCQNCIDPLDWEKPQKPRDGILRVGWAASDSHWKDIEIIGPAFRWAAAQKDVEIVILGIRPERFQHLGVPFTYVEWADSLADYRRNLSVLDVMVCPLKRGIWEDCKSDIKALEGVMAGAMPVVSRVDAYRPWWETEMPCMVAENTAGFVKAFRHLIYHRDEVKQLAKAAKEYVLSERTIEGNIWKWRQAVEDTVVHRSMSRALRSDAKDAGGVVVTS